MDYGNPASSEQGPGTVPKSSPDLIQALNPEPGPKPSPAWKWFLEVALLLLLVVILMRFFEGLDAERLLSRVAEGERRWWIAALVFLLGRLLVWDGRWRRSLRELGVQVRWTWTFPALLGAIFLNTVTPTGRVAGGLFRARHAVRGGDVGAAPVFGSVLYDQVLHQLVALAATVLSVLVLGVATGQQLWVAATLGTTALVLTLAWGIPAWGRLYVRRQGKAASERAERRGGWSGLVRWAAARIEQQGGTSLPLVTEGREALKSFRRLVGRPQLSRSGIALSLAMILLLALADWCCFLSLGSNPGLLVCLLAVSVGTAVGGLVGTPGGIGGVEAGMVLVLTSLGVETGDALATTVLFRTLHYVVVFSLGIPAFIWCEATRNR
jgi:uncharacterized protein (TIRG00374 family)